MTHPHISVHYRYMATGHYESLVGATNQFLGVIGTDPSPIYTHHAGSPKGLGWLTAPATRSVRPTHASHIAARDAFLAVDSEPLRALGARGKGAGAWRGRFGPVDLAEGQESLPLGEEWSSTIGLPFGIGGYL